jgi:hypothetical protein
VLREKEEFIERKWPTPVSSDTCLFCTALRKGSGANVHQRLLTGAEKSTGKDASKWQQDKGTGKGRGAPRGAKPEKEISFLDSLNSY